ncbi:MAG TPA: hypothetical protein VLI46_00360 [Ramlibacter sp.]|nr:hypothetical protein [Ramlibacter sp.]
MRFAAVITPPQRPLRKPAREVIRRIVGAPLQTRLPPEPAKPQEMPADLDQRVRLVGEW